jgi:hypothetical protein
VGSLSREIDVARLLSAYVSLLTENVAETTLVRGKFVYITKQPVSPGANVVSVIIRLDESRREKPVTYVLSFPTTPPLLLRNVAWTSTKLTDCALLFVTAPIVSASPKLSEMLTVLLMTCKVPGGTGGDGGGGTGGNGAGGAGDSTGAPTMTTISFDGPLVPNALTP